MTLHLVDGFAICCCCWLHVCLSFHFIKSLKQLRNQNNVFLILIVCRLEIYSKIILTFYFWNDLFHAQSASLSLCSLLSSIVGKLTLLTVFVCKLTELRKWSPFRLDELVKRLKWKLSRFCPFSPSDFTQWQAVSQPAWWYWIFRVNVKISLCLCNLETNCFP